MKKRLLSIVLAAALTVGTLLAAFPTAFAAEEGTKVWASWNVGENIKSAVVAANGDKDALKYNEFSYTGAYNGTFGIYSVSQAETYSLIVSNRSAAPTSQNQPWKCQLVINNNNSVTVHVATMDVQKLTFTAPVRGIYNFVPTAISASVSDSLSVGGPNPWTASVNVAGEAYDFGEGATSITVEAGATGNLPSISSVELQAGETIEVLLAPTATHYSGSGNYVSTNFTVELIDEMAPESTIVENDTFIVADELQVTNTEAAAPASTGLFTVGYLTTSVTMTEAGPPAIGSTLVAGSRPAYLTSDANGDYSFYYGKSDNHADYNLKAFPSTYTGTGSLRAGTVAIRNKNTAAHGVIITADKAGTYTFSASYLGVLSGNGQMVTVVEFPDGEIAYYTVGTGSEGFNVSCDLEVGEKVYVYNVRTGTNYTVHSVSIEDFTVERECKTTTVDPDYEFKYEYTEDNTNHADELAASADYALADGVLTVTFPEAPKGNTVEYNWAVWVLQDSRWVKLDATDANTFSGAVESEDGVYKTYILCTDDAGLTLLKTYDNYVDSVTAETAGNAVISGVYVDGVAVERDAYADIADGSVELKVEGANIASLTYELKYSDPVGMTDGAATLALTETGAYSIVITATSDKDGEAATKKIVINAYKADDEKVYGAVENVNVSVVDGVVTVNATGAAASYGYSVLSDLNGYTSTITKTTDTSATFDLTGKYGTYYARVYAYDENGNIDDVALTLFSIERDGEWSLKATTDGKNALAFTATVGEALNFTGSASHADVEASDVEYLFIKKDANGTQVIKSWGAWNKASFTPAYAGHYEITVAARAKGAGSYEVHKTYYIDVAGNTAEGNVAVSVDGSTAKTPVTFTATADSDEALLYRFTIETANNKKIVQKYSPSNTCTWIPTKAGTYTVKVEVISADSFGMYDVRSSLTFTVA